MTSPNDRYTSPLASRNASAEMLAIWSPRRKFTTWRKLWVALAEAQHELELDVTSAQIAEMFIDVTHPDTGESLFADAYCTADRIDRDPIEAMLPEVIAIPSPGFHTRQKFDQTGRIMRGDPSLTGTHRAEGVLMLGVPGATLGERHQASLRDVAPTILHLLGLPAGPEMQGTILDGMFADSGYGVGVAAEQISGPVIRRQAPMVGSSTPSELITRRLRELGYLE